MNRLLYTLIVVYLLAACELQSPRSNDRVLTTDELKQARIDFGRELFSDKRLSLDSSISCLDCHQPTKAFTDGLPLSNGIKGRFSFRNAPSLLNVGDFTRFMFDAQIPTLEMQALVPIQDTNEMGLTMKELVKRLAVDESYSLKAKLLYHRPLNAWVITKALSDFERSLQARNSRFDRYLADPESHPLSTVEQEGWQLFQGKGKCIECHALPDFTSGQARSNGYGSTDPIDHGRYRITGKAVDYGAFKVPSLRNSELTAPYMHNGKLNSLEEVLEFYASDKSQLKNVDGLVLHLDLSTAEQQSLITFLKTLTDTSYLSDW